MKINILKKTLNYNGGNTVFYELINIEDCCAGIQQMLDLGILQIVDAYKTYDILNFTADPNNLDSNLFVAMVITGINDLGDYNWDEEWEPNIQEVYSYYKINKCPICGEDFIFNITEKDISEEYKSIMDSFPKKRKNPSKENKKIIEELNAKLKVLSKSI